MLTGKRIWIIGGGSGIGRELALKLGQSGNRVVISGRGLDSLTAVSGQFQHANTGHDGSIAPLVFDVTEYQGSTEIASKAAELLGGIDILVFCAGRCEYIDNAELSVDLFRRVYDVNVFGIVNALASALPLMKQSNSAEKPQIVGIASLSTVVGLPRAEAYGSSKAAMIYLLDSLRLDLDKFGFDVTVVNPGFVETPMTASNDFPMPFIMQAGDAADCIIKGVAKRKRTVNFPWQLWLSLKLGAWLPSLWYRVIGPRLARRESVGS